MGAMERKKLEIFRYLSNTSNEKNINKICPAILRDEKDNWLFELSKAEKKSIERGMEDVKKGRTVPHEEVMKSIKKGLAIKLKKKRKSKK